MESNISNSKKFFWNMLGSLCNAISSVLLLIVVNRALGPEEGGVFSIAFATAQLTMTIGQFEVRPYQGTDINEKFKFSTYYTLRIISCSIMMLTTLFYIMILGYRGDKALVIILMSMYKMLDAFSDLFQGMFQQRDRIDLSGKTLAIRVILSTLGFISMIYITKSLVIGSLSMVIISVLWIIGYDYTISKTMVKIQIQRNFKLIYKLSKDCFPLFLSSFIAIYILNAPKYAIDRYMSLEIQNVYNILFMPASVINLFSIFLFRPLLTTLSNHWLNREWKVFKRLNRILFLWVIILTLVAFIGTYYLGIPILSWVYGIDLVKYKSALLIIILGGGLSAIAMVLYYILTVMRKQYYVLYGYLITCLVTSVIVGLSVKTYGILGASITYIIAMLIQGLCFYCLYSLFLHQEIENEKGY